jgi:sulfocyanin SoxE-like protein
LIRKVNTANTGNERVSWTHTSSPSHHSTMRGGGGLGGWLILAILTCAACDPLQGSGTGTPPDPSKYIQVDDSAHSAIVTLIAGYPATDYQFNYDGYASGALVLTVPVGWSVTIQCENRGTVPNSCAIVAGRTDTQPVDPSLSTPEPDVGLPPGQSASFVYTPQQPGSFRIASLVDGSEASGMWLDLEVVNGGRPKLTAPGG